MKANLIYNGYTLTNVVVNIYGDYCHVENQSSAEDSIFWVKALRDEDRPDQLGAAPGCVVLPLSAVEIEEIKEAQTMKKEWTESELHRVMQTVKTWINSRKFVTMHDGVIPRFRTLSQMDNVLGLPYTSSGRAACIGVCNTELYLDDSRKYRVISFEMDDYDIVYAVCFDKDENELLIPINK